MVISLERIASFALMEVYAAHQQVIIKTDNFYGDAAGALLR